MSKELFCERCKEKGGKYYSKCGHITHENCIQRLINNYCPKCREYFRDIEVETFLGKLLFLSEDDLNIKELYVCLKTIVSGYTRVFYYTDDILQRLQSLEWDINNIKLGGPNLFYQACKFDDLFKVNILIDHGIDLSKYGSKGLTCAHSSFDTFDRLIKLGVKLENEIFFYIILQNNFRMLSRVLKEGLDINSKDDKGISPIHYAVQVGTITMLDNLIKNGADFTSKDPQGDSILHYSCFSSSKKSLDFLKYFIESGFDTELYNNKKQTPLSVAVSKHLTNHIKFLIKKGANVNCRDINGNTPLHTAACEDFPEIMKILIRKGAIVNAKNYEGKTPLHVISLDNPVCASILLDNSADINALDNSKKPPLYYIYEYLDDKTMQRFIDEGADFSIKNSDGKNIREAIYFRKLKFRCNS